MTIVISIRNHTFLVNMGRVCRLEIKKPSISFQLKECNKKSSYYYISDNNERKKLVQYIKRMGDVLSDQSKIVVKREDLVESSYISDINFGSKGAILFSEQIINFYNEGVQERKIEHEREIEHESNIGDSNDGDDLPIEDRPQCNEIDHFKKYISRSFDVEQLVEITNCCSDRIKRIKQLTEESCNNETMRSLSVIPSVKSNQYAADRNASDKDTGVKKKRRIQPILVSKLNL